MEDFSLEKKSKHYSRCKNSSKCRLVGSTFLTLLLVSLIVAAVASRSHTSHSSTGKLIDSDSTREKRSIFSYISSFFDHDSSSSLVNYTQSVEDNSTLVKVLEDNALSEKKSKNDINTPVTSDEKPKTAETDSDDDIPAEIMIKETDIFHEDEDDEKGVANSLRGTPVANNNTADHDYKSVNVESSETSETNKKGEDLEEVNEIAQQVLDASEEESVKDHPDVEVDVSSVDINDNEIDTVAQQQSEKSNKINSLSDKKSVESVDTKVNNNAADKGGSASDSTAVDDEDSSSVERTTVVPQLTDTTVHATQTPGVSGFHTSAVPDSNLESVKQNKGVQTDDKLTKYSETSKVCNEYCISEDCVRAAMDLLTYIDKSIDPCDDFFEFACGNFDRQHVIPEDKAGYDTFSKLKDDLELKLRVILEEPACDKDGNATLKAKHLFQSCADEALIEKRGSDPLLKFISQLGGWPVLDPSWTDEGFNWIDLMAKLRMYNNDILVQQWVGPDGENSSRHIIQLDQTDLGLPSREYFFNLTDGTPEAYKKLMREVAILLGADTQTVDRDISEIFDFELQLANMTIPHDQRRDFYSIYKKITVGTLIERIPKIDWMRYLTAIMPFDITPEEEVVIYAEDYFHRLGDLIEKTKPRVVANYLIWRIVKNRVSNLDKDFLKLKLAFQKVLLGTEKEVSRWSKCVNYVNDNMGMAVGAMFVDKHFRQDAKEPALEMIREIRGIFDELLLESEWMDEKTKYVATEKAKAITEKIGYPDFIMNSSLLDSEYEDLEIHKDTYFENVLQNLKSLAVKEQQELRTPVNKKKWNTTPAVVNAFYSRSRNQIMFPAGILQPPFYSKSYPTSANYGGIGVVIGHEITHGFDDKGRQFDQHGNLKQWWSPDATKKFKSKAQCIIDQYGGYTVEQVQINVNGKGTQGENIADNGGLKQAYMAYKRWTEKHGPEPLLPGLGLTHDQIFFLNFAQIWCGTMRPQAMVQRLRTGVHSPSKYRVIGSLSNSHGFAKAYNCSLGSRMNPAKKCSVW